MSCDLKDFLSIAKDAICCAKTDFFRCAAIVKCLFQLYEILRNMRLIGIVMLAHPNLFQAAVFLLDKELGRLCGQAIWNIQHFLHAMNKGVALMSDTD